MLDNADPLWSGASLRQHIAFAELDASEFFGEI